MSSLESRLAELNSSKGAVSDIADAVSRAWFEFKSDLPFLKEFAGEDLAAMKADVMQLRARIPKVNKLRIRGMAVKLTRALQNMQRSSLNRLLLDGMIEQASYERADKLIGQARHITYNIALYQIIGLTYCWYGIPGTIIDGSHIATPIALLSQTLYYLRSANIPMVLYNFAMSPITFLFGSTGYAAMTAAVAGVVVPVLLLNIYTKDKDLAKSLAKTAHFVANDLFIKIEERIAKKIESTFFKGREVDPTPYYEAETNYLLGRIFDKEVNVMEGNPRAYYGTVVSRIWESVAAIPDKMATSYNFYFRGSAIIPR